MNDTTLNEIAVFGGGCFWCTEAVFTRLRGVQSVLPGYAGGSVPHPSYDDVCSGTTGHAEVIRIAFDPTVITFEQLLDVFMNTHDPTTLNRQGNDVGTQYRSVILYTSDHQKKIAEKYLASHQKDWHRPIVTQIEPLTDFYEAESYHKDYFAKNDYQPYCQVIIAPKVKHFLEQYSDIAKQP